MIGLLERLMPKPDVVIVPVTLSLLISLQLRVQPNSSQVPSKVHQVFLKPGDIF